MVRVGVGVKAGLQLDPEFADEGEVAAVLFKHRVDQHRLAAGHIRQQIGVGARVDVKQLAEQQRLPTGSGGEIEGGGGSHGGGGMLL